VLTLTVKVSVVVVGLPWLVYVNLKLTVYVSAGRADRVKREFCPDSHRGSDLTWLSIACRRLNPEPLQIALLHVDTATQVQLAVGQTAVLTESYWEVAGNSGSLCQPRRCPGSAWLRS